MNPQPDMTNIPAAHAPRQILARAGHALKLGRCFTALACGLVAAGVVLGICLLADASTCFSATGRWLGFAAFLLPLVAALVQAVRAGLRPLDDAALARRLETTTGRSDNALVNAVQLDRSLDAASPWRAVLLDELAGLWRGIAWQRVYDWRVLWRWATGAGALLLLGLALFAWRPNEFRQRLGRVLLPASEIAPLTRTRVVAVAPGDRVVSRGTQLTMQVALAGVAPAEVWLVVAKTDGSIERMATPRVPGSMTWEVACTWTESGRYWFEAGDARSFERRIAVQAPAKVLARVLTIVPPRYTHLPSVRVADGSAWPAIPAGSDVTLEWTFDRGIKTLSVDDGAAVASLLDKPETWKLTGRPVINRPWSTHWSDVSELSDQAKVAFNLKADEAPRLRLIQPTGEEEVLLTRDAALHLTFEASDDYGLAEVTVFRGTPKKPDARVIQSWKPATRSFKQTIDIQLSRWLAKQEGEAWFCVAARDGNDVTGPGRTLSRLLVVRIVTADELRRVAENRQGEALGSLDDLLHLQQTNLDATRALLHANAADAALATVTERQVRIQQAAGHLVASTPAGSAAWREVLVALLAKELPQALLALREAVTAKASARRNPLAKAEALEAAILARLKCLPVDLRDEAIGAAVRDLIGRVEALFTRQKALHSRTIEAVKGEGTAIAGDQDTLADESRTVRQALADGAHNASLGDATFRAVLDKAATLMTETKIYEQMIRSAEQCDGEHFSEAADLSKKVLLDLARVLELLNTSQRSTAGDKADSLKESAADIHEKLAALVEQQRAVVEKSQALAAKDQFSPEDVAVAKELAAKKAELAKLIEQMLTDAHALPDLRPMNELREELTKIYEDVIQQDTAQAAAGALKPSEIAVQKEESLLTDLEKAAKTAADMEMWLPDKNETTKWLMENFDLTEMPKIPNLPLPDAFTDLVGDLLKEQEGLAEQVQDAASNNAFAINPANGWEVADGPMPGFNAQGKSGNTPPNKNEQTGRSSGGREGMSSGEMVNQRADHLEGSSMDARRTNDPMQKGQVQDNGPPADAKATGGGKAGGVSQRAGMTGEAPLRAVNTPDRILNNALAAEQALLAQQTAKSYATARLFYLRSGALPEVAKLMDESHDALKSGRLADYQALHPRIVAGLRQLGEATTTQAVKVLDGGRSRFVGEKRLPGGADVAVPAGYQQPVDDYFRSLDTP
ncbi:MAG: DUF4175 domain-containing protein [Verrucomicrobia bacterium]|nr:MAG: DUF4175 domain-containing protein [Verrucomicrobiota bacterium]